MRCYKFGSLTRTSDLQVNPFTVHPMKRDQWATGDYVVGKYCGVSTDDEWVENTFGKETSRAPSAEPHPRYEYVGHVIRVYEMEPRFA